MTRNLTEYFCQIFIIGKNGSTVAVTTQRLAGEKAGTGNSGQVAGALALVGGTKALCGIFDHRNAVLGGNCVDGIEISALAIQ
ncbi:hypothetical protein D3C85_1354710 [compost metagenome]